MINDYIGGKTHTYGLLGNPIDHTFSPFIYNTIERAVTGSGQADFVYVPFLVKDGNIEAAVRGAHALNIQGLSVTVPYKKDVMPLLRSINKTAMAAGAVNVLKYTEDGYDGYNTDVYGVIKTLENENVGMKDKNAVVLGAGGGAAASAVALCEMGAKKIFIVNRTPNTAKQLAKHISQYYNVDIEYRTFDELGSLPICEVAIQTTTLGFGPHKGISPVPDIGFFNNVRLVFDIIYNPWETVFLADAKKCGVTAINGFDMLVFQAFAAFEIWKGKSFDNDFVNKTKSELKDFLNF